MSSDELRMKLPANNDCSYCGIKDSPPSIYLVPHSEDLFLAGDVHYRSQESLQGFRVCGLGPRVPYTCTPACCILRLQTRDGTCRADHDLKNEDHDTLLLSAIVYSVPVQSLKTICESQLPCTFPTALKKCSEFQAPKTLQIPRP